MHRGYFAVINLAYYFLGLHNLITSLELFFNFVKVSYSRVRASYIHGIYIQITRIDLRDLPLAKMTKKQLAVCEIGKEGEKKAKRWLEKNGYKITDHHHGKSIAGCFDITATKNKKKWIIEVKNGENPTINIANFEKMVNQKGYDRIGLALVGKDDVYLLEFNRWSLAGRKAAKTKGKRVSLTQERRLLKLGKQISDRTFVA
jgi:hypothetical protein